MNDFFRYLLVGWISDLIEGVFGALFFVFKIVFDFVEEVFKELAKVKTVGDFIAWVIYALIVFKFLLPEVVIPFGIWVWEKLNIINGMCFEIVKNFVIGHINQIYLFVFVSAIFGIVDLIFDYKPNKVVEVFEIVFSLGVCSLIYYRNDVFIYIQSLV